MKISLAQIHIEFGNPRRNLEKASQVISNLSPGEVDLVVFPELWTTGYDLENWRDHVRENREVVLPTLSELAYRNGFYIAGSLLSGDLTGAQNTLYLLGKDGKIAGKYSKVHLFSLMEEDKWLKPGDYLQTVQMPLGRIGLAICYDLRFPELFRNLALAGAQVIILPAEWPEARIEHWKVLLRARAIENQVFIVGVNRVGIEKGNTFPGTSMVVAPDGTVLLALGKQEEVACVTLDLPAVEEARRSISILADRQPGVYDRPVKGTHSKADLGDVY